MSSYLRSRRPTVPVLVACSALLLPAAASSSSPGPAFPPGLWCGSAKAPVGKTVKIGGILATLEKGEMSFVLSSTDGKVAGDSSAESVINADGRLKAGTTTLHGQFRFDGTFELEGSARLPELVGTWRITGVILVNSREVPFKQNVKATKSNLAVDSASSTKAAGRWISAANTYVGWKWTAHRPKVGKGSASC
jgi:hypothetical protein